jgi:hypothetical protein
VDAASLKEANVQVLLVKPFESLELLNQIDRLLHPRDGR